MAPRGLFIPTRFDLNTARRDLQSLKAEGKKVGGEAGDLLVKQLRTNMQNQLGAAREALQRGLIDKRQFQRIRNDLNREFNQPILAGLKQLRAEGKQNTEEFNRMQRSLRNVARTTNEVGREGSFLGRAFKGAGASAKLFVATFTAGGFYLIARGIRGLLGEVTKLDAALTESLAIMGDVPAHLRAQMETTARRLSRELKLSAEDLGRSFFFLASAGLDAEQSIAALPVVARFAKAGMFDLQAATDLLTDAQSALGLASKDQQQNMENMTRIADVLVKANTLANASVQQFSESLTNDAAAALRLVNKDVEEGVAVLAALADQGTKGADAGTRLAIVLRDLQKAALNNREAFREAGISVFDSAGKMRSMADILEDVERRFDGMSDAQKRAEITGLGFQDRSVQALLALIGLSGKVREYEVGLRSAAGTTQEIAQKQLAAMEQRLGIVGEKWNNLRRVVGETILLPVAEWFVGLADAMLSTDKPLDRLIARLERLGAAPETLRPLQLQRDIEASRKELERLEREFRTLQRGFSTADLVSAAGPGAGPAILAASRGTPLSGDAARQALIEAQRSRDQALGASDTRRAERLTREIDRLQQLIAKEKELETIRSAIRTAERQIPEADREAGIRREIDEIDRQLTELAARESAATVALERTLRDRRKVLAEQLAPPPADPGTDEGGMPEEDDSAEVKRRAEERLRIETELADRLFRLTATVTEESIRQLDKLVEAYRAAGGVITAEIQAQIDAIRHDLLLGGELEKFRQEFAQLTERKVSAETLSSMEAFAEKIRLQRDLVDESHDRWKELDVLLKQVESRMTAIQGDAAVAAVQDAFARRMNDLREALASGLIDEKQFEEQGRKAGEAFKAGILAAIEQLRAAGGLTEELRAALLSLIPSGSDDAVKRATQERIRALREQARTIEENARAAVSLAESFGLIDSEAAQALDSIIQLGTSVGRIAGGDLTAIPAAVASLAQLASSLFGESPADKERREILKRNTTALEDLALELSGFKVDADILQRFLNAEVTLRGNSVYNMRPGIEGFSDAQLRAIERELGITLFDSKGRLIRGAVAQAQEAIRLRAEQSGGLTAGAGVAPQDRLSVSMTVVQGNRLVDLTASILDRQRASAEHLAALRAHLTGGLGLEPSGAPMAAGGGPVSIDIGGVHVSVTGGADAAATGQAVGEKASDVILDRVSGAYRAAGILGPLYAKHEQSQ